MTRPRPSEQNRAMTKPRTAVSKPRESNFELLRILAMFFVLVVHADFGAIGVPTSAEASSAPLTTATRILFEFTAIVSVNLFVLISGWFGIRASVRGFVKLLFQAVFFSTTIFVLFVALGKAQFTPDTIYDALLNEWTNSQWFVVSYMILYCLAPVLNAYIDKASSRQLATTILVYMGLQTFASFLMGVDEFMGGYSGISFTGLYLLARWLRLHGKRFITPAIGWALILAPIVIGSITDYFIILNNVDKVTTKLLSYANPLVILQSAGYLILFAGLKPFVNRAVNWISGGAFAVYLIHTNTHVYIHFKTFIQGLYADYSGVMCILAIAVFLGAVFVACSLIDRLIREPAWRAAGHAFPRCR